MANARKRQRIPVLPCSVARDALLAGESPPTVAACAADATLADRMRLALDLFRAAGELLRGDGVHYSTVSTYLSDGRVGVSFQTYTDSTDAVNAALVELGEAGLYAHAYAGALARKGEGETATDLAADAGEMQPPVSEAA